MTHYLYSGNFLYSSNSSSHSCSVLGGFIPFSKFHCVIDSPDSVNLHQHTQQTPVMSKTNTHIATLICLNGNIISHINKLASIPGTVSTGMGKPPRYLTSHPG